MGRGESGKKKILVDTSTVWGRALTGGNEWLLYVGLSRSCGKCYTEVG